MTIPSNVTRNSYTGTGITGPYPVTFKFFEDADLLVTVADADGVETVQTLTTDYTVTGAGEQAGGAITFTSAVTNGYSIVIEPKADLTQDTDIKNEGGNLRESIEDRFDRLCRDDQVQQNLIDRSVKLKITDVATTDPELPTPEAGRVLRWNDTGTGLVNASGATDSAADVAVISTGSTTSRWASDRFAEVANLRDFGGVGDGVANDTLAITTWLSHIASTGVRGLIPAGTYLTDPITLDQSYSGIHISGSSANQFAPTFGVDASVLKLRSSGTHLVKFAGAWSTVFDGVSFDANSNATAATVHFSGTSSTSFKNQFVGCTFYGSVASTGITLLWDGTTQGDLCFFDRCVFYGVGYTSSDSNLSIVVNTNQNAFNIDFWRCSFYRSIKMFDYGNGSCNLRRCELYFATSYFVYVRNVTKSFCIDDCYTEQAPGVPFLYQAGTAGVSSAGPISVRSVVVNDTNAISLNCQQPVVIEKSTLNGGLVVNPMATYGVHSVSVDNVDFGTSGVSGTGAASNVNYSKAWSNGRYLVDNKNLPHAQFVSSVTYSASMAVNAALANFFSIGVSDANPFTIQNPTNGAEGQQITFFIYYATGGALGAISWGASYKTAGAFTLPSAPGKMRSVTFMLVGGVWNEICRNAADVG